MSCQFFHTPYRGQTPHPVPRGSSPHPRTSCHDRAPARHAWHQITARSRPSCSPAPRRSCAKQGQLAPSPTQPRSEVWLWFLELNTGLSSQPAWLIHLPRGSRRGSSPAELKPDPNWLWKPNPQTLHTQQGGRPHEHVLVGQRAVHPVHPE